MQIKPAELSRHLAAGLLPGYLVSGDEPLLVQEACDLILAAARDQAFAEREVLHVEPGFKWHDVTQSAAARSLFSERRVIDLRLTAPKFDKDASEVLRGYAAAPPDDTMLLVRAPRLEARQRSAAWFKALDAVFGIVLVWPVGIRDMPGWLSQRLRAAPLELTPDALRFLIERVEGNLLAAVQEIEKLKLQGLSQPIGLEDLIAVTEDVSHHDVFQLVDAVLGGDAARVRRILANLQAAGVSMFAVLGALTGQLRRIAAGARQPGPRGRLVDTFQRRVGAGTVPRVLAECALIDQQGKGGLYGDPWLSLEALALRLAGARGLPPLLGQQLTYRIVRR